MYSSTCCMACYKHSLDLSRCTEAGPALHSRPPLCHSQPHRQAPKHVPPHCRPRYDHHKGHQCPSSKRGAARRLTVHQGTHSAQPKAQTAATSTTTRTCKQTACRGRIRKPRPRQTISCGQGSLCHSRPRRSLPHLQRKRPQHAQQEPHSQSNTLKRPQGMGVPVVLTQCDSTER